MSEKTCDVCTSLGHEWAHAHKVILLTISPFLRTMQKTIDSDFSGQNTPSVISLLKLQGILQGNSRS